MASTSRQGIGATIGVLGILAVLLGLGTWQLQRRIWKEDLLAAMSARSALPPAVDLSKLDCRPAAGWADPCEFRPVRLSVTFQHDQERHIFISVPPQADGVGGPGYWVFTPARTADGQGLYVNRGFVPERLKDVSVRAAGQIGGSVTLEGVLRRSETRGRFAGANDPKRNIYFIRSPEELSNLDGPEPRPSPDRMFNWAYYIDMTGPPASGGLPRPLAGKIAIPNRHLEYALTWYGLALTWLVIVWVRSRPPAVNAD
jgi:surfeit locus 1 family protein